MMMNIMVVEQLHPGPPQCGDQEGEMYQAIKQTLLPASEGVKRGVKQTQQLPQQDQIQEGLGEPQVGEEPAALLLEEVVVAKTKIVIIQEALASYLELQVKSLQLIRDKQIGEIVRKLKFLEM